MWNKAVIYDTKLKGCLENKSNYGLSTWEREIWFNYFFQRKITSFNFLLLKLNIYFYHSKKRTGLE